MDKAFQTWGQRRRARRDRVLRAVYRTGLVSQRLLAEVFDLSRARVHSILHAPEPAAPNPPRPKRERGRGKGG